MKTDKIMELSLLLEEIYRDKEQNLFKEITELQAKIKELNDLATTLERNKDILEKVYEDELKEIGYSKSRFHENFDPFDRDNLSGAFKELKELSIVKFDGNFESVSKVYFLDKMNNKYPEKNIKEEIKKI